MSEKSKLVERLFKDLVGPMAEDEVLSAYPTDTYLTGILFPPRSDVAQEDADQLRAEGQSDADGSDVSRDEVSLATVKRPASAGISFVVECSDGCPRINISVEAAIYQREVATSNSEDGDEDVPLWRRIPVRADISPVSLDFSSRDFSSDETGVEGLGLHVRTSPWENRTVVTVALINSHQLPESYERASYEEICFFQTQLVVTVGESTALCPRPLGGSAIDEDTSMASLIYSDVKEYAVGHTCSADWIESDSGVSAVRSNWLPSSTVRVMSSLGVEDFRPLTENRILSTDWLSETSGERLVSGLKMLPDLYQQWCDSEAEKVDDLDLELRGQARKHLSNGELVRQRIEGSILLIEQDREVETAFRLANRAIQLQRQWSASDDTVLVWRPFQLGFFLLTLESLANPDHEDRDVADLLWFPAGGGKTEAYLGLIAFTLFLRRLRYGNTGAGVASFMRYTLRLLTVQQFQRAAALICACESIRLGQHVPDGVNVDLADIPFSLGLWVGGDTTPNRFAEARESLRDETAHSRPDQLKYCPRHQTSRLVWWVDESTEEIYANCESEDCPWHRKKLPVWTVDNNVYDHQPSLVIGTIDKFAQVARNPRTPQLFGLGSSYRQPDLIIQDELHLISGPLGTLAGLYEIAIDRLCSRDGIAPKIIASTATIRQASSQIRELFNRETCLFPPPMLDAKNSGFAVEDLEDPGRQYLGITTAGRSAKFALQAATASLMQAVGSSAISDDVRDDFWTTVVYFNSLRELGGALVLMQDDVGNSIVDYADRCAETPRSLSEPMELTSRVGSSEIKNYLDQLARRYDQPGACDVVLASNMISVGVDVPRLGLMLVNGQPKGIAEYIQATSRVGRRRGGPGGLVLTIYNNAKSRDRSHFETFRTWHMALYREVEATSVTPFAPRAREKALHAVLVIMARHLVPELNSSVDQVGDFQDELEDFIEFIVDRAEGIDSEEAGGVEDELNAFLEGWLGSASAYKQYWNDRSYDTSLMLSAEKAAEIKSRSGSYHGRAVPTPNSMRNVEPGSLYVLEERLR